MANAWRQQLQSCSQFHLPPLSLPGLGFDEAEVPEASTAAGTTLK